MLMLCCACPIAAAQAQPYSDYARTSRYVAVRDGTRLAVNIYRPATGTQAVQAKLPVIFVFTPYRARFRDDQGKVIDAALNDQLALRSLIAAGYVVAVADVRGKGASFGTRFGFQSRTEANDGHDLIQWLAGQDFSTGVVGMVGCSYLGGTTFHTTSTAPPALKASFIGASDLDKYAFVRRGGITAQFNTRPDEPPAVDLASIPVDADTDGAQLKVAVGQHAANTPMAPLWYGMPFRDSISPFTGDAFWQEASVYSYLDAVRRSGIATYFWGNWQDEPTGQVILGAANTGGKFLAGPGSHCVPPPGFGFTGEVVRYFDHYLKGVDNGIEREPRATYWVEGLNGKGSYVHSAKLPGMGSRAVSWFLGGGRSGTARSVNDGLLLRKSDGAGQDRFTVDYNVPDADYFAFWAKPMEDKGLSYTSAPLAAPLKLIGFPVIHLTLKADKPDAPVFVYLEQVAPDGVSQVVSFSRISLSHRKLSPAPYDTMGLPWHSGRAADVSPLPIGQAATLDFDLTPIARVVPAGSRLRVTITGADPRQRNLRQIMLSPPPIFTVLRGERHGSTIQLPVAN